jgi:hypothetical protein
VPKRWAVASGATAGLLCCVIALTPSKGESPAPLFADAHEETDSVQLSPALRDTALHTARVSMPAGASVAALDRNPPDPTGALSQPIVECQYMSAEAKGTTPKFRCSLPNGDIVRVKYGDTGEVPAELAATRLLTALGYGADRMYLVPRVRCYGCPRFPFQSVWVLDRLHARDVVTPVVSQDRYTDFEWATIERHLDGVEITSTNQKGWAWYELDQMDSHRGSTRAEIDAFRLLARFVAHWDNKASNQRLVCRSMAGETCREPFAYIQDLGSTFGPSKVNLENWENAVIWSDRARCVVSMRDFPYEGATFTDVEITEHGRALLVRQLERLTEAQIDGLFSGARFREFNRGSGRAADVKEWTRVFRDKVREIASGAPCPS